MGVTFDDKSRGFVFDFEHDGAADIVSLVGNGYQIEAFGKCFYYGYEFSEQVESAVRSAFIKFVLNHLHASVRKPCSASNSFFAIQSCMSEKVCNFAAETNIIPLRMNRMSLKEKSLAVCRWVGSLWYMKYVVVVVLGVVLVGFTGENSLMAHQKYLTRINELQEEIDDYARQFQHDQSLLRQLQTDPKMVEKVAREHYFMRRSGEDIFVMEDEL